MTDAALDAIAPPPALLQPAIVLVLLLARPPLLGTDKSDPSKSADDLCWPTKIIIRNGEEIVKYAKQHRDAIIAPQFVVP